jgi:hypothetical protein
MCTFIFGYIALTATIPLTKKIVMILFEGVPSNVRHVSYKGFRHFYSIHERFLGMHLIEMYRWMDRFIDIDLLIDRLYQ